MRKLAIIGLLLTGFAFADDVDRLITELGAKKYASRQTAQQKLVELAGTDPEAFLQRIVREYAASRDPEIRTRLREALEELVDRHIYHRPRGYLGIRMQMAIVAEVDKPAQLRIQVADVTANSAAERAGVLAGDQITGVDGKQLDMQGGLEKFTDYIRAQKPGTSVKLQLLRAQAAQEVPVVLDAMPAEVQQQLFSDVRKQQFFEEWLRDQLARVPAADGKIDKPSRGR